MSNGITSIVVACDGSAQSRKATTMAATLANATGAPLRLLSVFPSARAEILAIRGVRPGGIEDNKSHYRREVFNVARDTLGSDIKVDKEIFLSGDPAAEIIHYIDDHPGTHLVLGRRGHSLVRSLTLGSVSEKVIRHASGPVTVVSD